MPEHYTNELIFDLPEQLIDTTHHIFTLSKDGPSEFNLVIGHNRIEPDETLQGYGGKLADELNNSLPNYQLESSGSMVVAGRDALWLVYSWVQQGQRLHQAQVNFFHDKTPEERDVIQITATVPGPFSDHWKQTFETILASVKFRQEAE